MVRLPLGQWSLARNAGKVKQRSTPDFGSRLAYSRRDSGGGVTGKRVYRNPGQTPRASRSDLTCSVGGLEILGLARRKATRALKFIIPCVMRPGSGLFQSGLPHNTIPRLAPWAAFLRRFAAR